MAKKYMHFCNYKGRIYFGSIRDEGIAGQIELSNICKSDREKVHH